MSEYPTKSMVKFLDDLRELLEKHPIEEHSGFIQHDELGTYLDICFRVKPPDLGVKVSDGIGAEDIVR